MPTLLYACRGQSESVFHENASGQYSEAALVAAGVTTSGGAATASEVARRLPGWTVLRVGSGSTGPEQLRWSGTSFVSDWIDPRIAPGDDTPISSNTDPRIAGKFGQDFFDHLDTLLAANAAGKDAGCTVWMRQTWEGADPNGWPFDYAQYARAITLFETYLAAKWAAALPGKPYRSLFVPPGPTDRDSQARMREVQLHLAMGGRRSTRPSLAGFAVLPHCQIGSFAGMQVTFANADLADDGVAGSGDSAHQSQGSAIRTGRALGLAIARWLSPGTAQEFRGHPVVSQAFRVAGAPNLLRVKLDITPGNRLAWQGPNGDASLTVYGASTASPSISHLSVHATPIDTASVPAPLAATSITVDNSQRAGGVAYLDITLAGAVPTPCYFSHWPHRSAAAYTRLSEATATTNKLKLGLWEDATQGGDLVVDAAMSDLLRSPIQVAMPVLPVTNLLVLEKEDALSSFSDYAETAVLNWLLTNSAVTRPTAWFAALGTASTDSSFAEISGGNYARVACPLSVSGSLATNAGVLSFPTPSADWGSVSHVAIFDAASGGNRLAQGPLVAPVAVVSGAAPKFAAGDFDLTLD